MKKPLTTWTLGIFFCVLERPSCPDKMCDFAVPGERLWVKLWALILENEKKHMYFTVAVWIRQFLIRFDHNRNNCFSGRHFTFKKMYRIYHYSWIFSHANVALGMSMKGQSTDCCWLASHFGPDWNLSTPIGWIAIQSSTDIYGSYWLWWSLDFSSSANFKLTCQGTTDEN